MSFIKSDQMGDLLKTMNDLARQEVLVGIPDSAPQRDDSPLSNAQIGYIQETGSPANNLPARPFLVPGVEEVQDKVANTLQKAADAALSGDTEVMRRQLESVGLTAQDSVQQKINTGPFVPLALSTIEARARKGRKGAKKFLKQMAAGGPPEGNLVKPLIDTGSLRDSITYVLRKKGSGNNGAT